MELITNDLIADNINPYLNRLEKNALRATNKKFYKSIIYQSILNENYELDCARNITSEMIYWRRKGALRVHEEVYNLFTDNKTHLAQKLCLYDNRALGAFCLKSAFVQGVTLNNKLFIQFLLQTKKPSYNSNVLTKSIVYSEQLGHNTITETLMWHAVSTKPSHHISHKNYYLSLAPFEQTMI